LVDLEEKFLKYVGADVEEFKRNNAEEAKQ
jgi:hypothetical protein